MGLHIYNLDFDLFTQFMSLMEGKHIGIDLNKDLGIFDLYVSDIEGIHISAISFSADKKQLRIRRSGKNAEIFVDSNQFEKIEIA